MSATARKKGAGKRWDAGRPATEADSSAPKVNGNHAKQAPPSTKVAVGQSSAETLKKRLTRLALDVHDGPMQNLAVIGFSLSDIRRRMRTLVPPDEHANIDAGMEQITTELGRVESELRALIGALEHGGVTSVPVVDAIELEIAEFQRRAAAEVTLTVEGDISTETDSQRIALQSVTRAALANVAKHAAAEHVSIRVRGDQDSLTLEIEDDGRGFKSTAPPKRGRMGLVGMKDRVELLGGEFKVSSRPGGPTTITATLHTWRPDTA
ncbi:MAG TPA: ATP-binding protein [Gaiellaceae bacterium]|nr:ATP-binding protein [Gaiellaceae bacterium]